MALTNLKTNNVALQQMLQFVTGSAVSIEDTEASRFKVTADADFINLASYVHATIRDLKAAGVDYFINYAKTNIEDYKAYFKDRRTVEFKDSAVPNISATMAVLEEEPYGYLQINPSFTLNRDELNSADILKVENPCLLKDSATMTFTQNGVVTQSAEL